MIKHLVTLLVGLTVTAPSFVLAQSAASVPLSPGCRAATAADMKARADRGISPVDQQVCPGDVVYLGIGESFDQWYAKLRNTSPCNRNTETLSVRTKNTGAQVCGPVSRKWNSIGCHPNNNTAIFPSVAYGFAAHIDLLRQYCGTKGRCTIASAIQMWAPASDGNNPTSYAATVSKWSGQPANQVYDPNDIDLMGRIALSMSCVEAGSLPYDVNELKQGLSMAGGGARVPVPANVGEVLQQSLQGSYAPNAGFTSTAQPGNFQTFPPPTGMSPGYIPPPTGINPYQQSSFVQPVNSSQGTPVYPTTNMQDINSPDTNSSVGPAGAPALDIKVWPRTLYKGQTLLVYWTSVNMSQNSCQVVFQNQKFADGNAGVKPLRTTSYDQGTISFTLQCADKNGTQRSVTDSAILLQ